MPTDLETWRSIRGDLEGLPHIEWNLTWTSRALSAQLAPIQLWTWDQNEWTWDQPEDVSLQARATAVFLKAAKARGYENEDQWLDELRYADFVEFEFIGRATDRLPDGTYTNSKSWVLKDAVKHSITLCHQLEAEDVPKPIIGRLPREAIARIEAATVAFMADFEPKLDREVLSLEKKLDRRVCEAKLFREMVVHYFATAARECMSLFPSVDEFEAVLRAGIARFVHFGVGQYEWLGPMQKELDAGFTLFVKRADPWAGIAEADRESKWHVGAIIGEALTHTALELVAEAAARAADTLRDKNGATKPKADESVRTAAEADQKTSSIEEAASTNDATPKPEPARTKRTKREPTADEVANALDGKDAVSYETAEGLLGVGRRQLTNLVRRGVLANTNHRKLTTASIRKFLGPREDTQRDDRMVPASVRHN